MLKLVDHDTFLKQLNALFESSKDQGSVWITHKRLSYNKEETAMKAGASANDTREYPCLLRVSDGGKTKFSTTVKSSELEKFYHLYGTFLKSSMTTLRKRDKKREKQRAEQAAARKKKLSEPIVIDGPKRGKGRRRRQRQVKAALKQQEALNKIKAKEEAKGKVAP
ncbi:signal recognition particle, SRP9/SRP14 subunit [Rhodocollybia butyracea]|uniref:Signal recognition particle subunit SRP14 n=1 Tax=Rhodocollybia butyracea TaxID=206335 RepID=A0A9P5Q5M2_9AGAR|nr:signal recognition particle, SRP9/SRP14 subunit [Rhodocollybia butyracea]